VDNLSYVANMRWYRSWWPT